MKCPNCGSAAICAQAIVDWHATDSADPSQGYWKFEGCVAGGISCCCCGFNSDDIAEFEGPGAPEFGDNKETSNA